MAENNAVSVVTKGGEVVSPFSGITAFEAAQRMSKALSCSSMIPDSFRSRSGDNGVGVANTLVAFQLAARLNVDVFMVMQNVYAIHGRPSFSSAFIIATVNTCGRFTPLQFEYIRDKDGKAISCCALANDKRSGVLLKGTPVTLEMAKREGWSTKSGSKWTTMPEQMMAYRAASFWARLYAPDVILGMHSVEEEEDQSAAPVSPVISNLNTLAEETSDNPVVDTVIVEVPRNGAIDSLNDLVDGKEVV